MDANKLPKDPTLVALSKKGEELKSRILALIENWPFDESGAFCDLSKTSPAHQEEATHLRREVTRWFNTIKVQIIPLQIEDSARYLPDIFRLVKRRITVSFRGASLTSFTEGRFTHLARSTL